MKVAFTYQDLLKLDDETKSEIAFSDPVRMVLKDFMFKNLLKDKSIFCSNPPAESGEGFDEHKLSILKIRHSIINYLYSGSFTLIEIDGKYNYSTKTQKIIQENLTSNFDFEIQNYQYEIIQLDDQLKSCSSQIQKNKVIEKINKFQTKLRAINDEKTKYIENQKKIDELKLKIRSEAEEDIFRKLIESNTKSTPDDFYIRIETSWNHVFAQYNQYLSNLNIKLEDDRSIKIEKIIVYEAPPYISNKEAEEAYFFTSASKQYSDPIRKCFDPLDSLKALSLEQFLVHFNLGFFDISLACLPLSKGDIRKEWNTKDYFKIGNKQITVVLFEIAFEHFIEKVGINQISKHPLFAIGAPVNCSAGIFEYYSENLLRHGSISVDLSITNNTTTYKKRKAHGETFPLYKSNIINSGYPSDILMKNAFNMDID
jgi:hypothetical protein